MRVWMGYNVCDVSEHFMAATDSCLSYVRTYSICVRDDDMNEILLFCFTLSQTRDLNEILIK